jgi:hypothetical protein
MDSDLDKDRDIDAHNLALYLEANCVSFQNERVFNIADLVMYGWDYKNNGSNVIQVRSYPVGTTGFSSETIPDFSLFVEAFSGILSLMDPAFSALDGFRIVQIVEILATFTRAF